MRIKSTSWSSRPKLDFRKLLMIWRLLFLNWLRITNKTLSLSFGSSVRLKGCKLSYKLLSDPRKPNTNRRENLWRRKLKLPRKIWTDLDRLLTEVFRLWTKSSNVLCVFRQWGLPDRYFSVPVATSSVICARPAVILEPATSAGCPSGEASPGVWPWRELSELTLERIQSNSMGPLYIFCVALTVFF